MQRLLAAFVLFLMPTIAGARPPYKQALIDHFGPHLPRKLHDCRTCHLPDRPGQDETDKPHNTFGARLKAVRSELRRAGKKTDLVSRLEAVADEDSDGDGVSNVLELLAGHFPGDPADKPSAAEVAEARHRLAALRARQREAYAWRPFEAVERPAVPTVRNAAWMRNPIDAFVAAGHERHGLRPRPEAGKAVLLRRVYLDLTGLPPTREELHAFLDDPAPDAYEQVVDRLLASPRYGERWGRHWMDVWRYSDWAGFGAEVRDSRKHIWHWRDWIVESLNADKGYDRMVQEMLAADELTPGDADAARATGFLVRNWYLFNRNVWLERCIEHTGKAFLGVTLNCARCHDHFFDPFTQKEYYAFRAVFEPHDVRTDRVPGVVDIDRDGLPRVYDKDLAAPTYPFIRGDEAHPDKTAPIAPGVPAALGGDYEVQPVVLPLEARTPERRAFVNADNLAAAQAAIAQSVAAADRARGTATAAVAAALGGDPLSLAARAPLAQRALAQSAVAELDEDVARARRAALEAILVVERLEDARRQPAGEWRHAARQTAVAQRQLALLEARRQVEQGRLNAWFVGAQGKADAARKLAEAQASLTKAEESARQPVTTAYTPRPLPVYPATSTGRRLALARWITDRHNPLAARVAVNHVWLRHFGRALVPTEFDFGRNGQPPTHPALLDWLAAEFMERGWRLKALHRLMVTSAAYRMDSAGDEANQARDPDNRFLWRRNVRRMEAEVVRDSVLYVAGNLDLTAGGPDIDHALGQTSRRRSLYFRHAAEKQMEFLALFDAANVNECYRRTESIVPQQALALSNSALALGQARLLGRRLAQEADTPAAFIRAGFETVLSRPPTRQEEETCARFLADQAALLADPRRLTASEGPANPVPPSADPTLRAREDLIHVLLNHHDFVTIR